MGAHPIRRWIDSFLNRGGSKRRAQRPTFRPRLEALEERTLLNAGMLDPTFGNGGVVVDNSISIHSQQWVLGVQPDGKLVEAGGGDVYGLQGLQVVRTNVDGSLDGTFLGSSGSPYYSTAGYFSTVGVVVEADGKILVAGRDELGYSSPPNAGEAYHDTSDFFVARFNSDGSLDGSFGVGGIAVTPFSGQVDVAGMVVQADGEIVMVGTVNGQITLTRYNADGSPDATFGNAGTVVTPLVGWQDNANGIALQSDGKILVAGKFVESIATSDFGAVRYNTDGTLDATFGNGGIVDTPFVGENSQALGVAVQANGDVVIAGDADADGQHFYAALARYTPNGRLDATFGNGGQVLTNVSKDSFASVRLALQADGKILLGTSDIARNLDAEEVVLARFDGDGGIDASFGDRGVTFTSLGQYSASLADMALEPDGSIVMVGCSFTARLTNPDQIGKIGPFLTLARFQNDSLPLVLSSPPPAASPQTSDHSAADQPGQAPVVSSVPPAIVRNSLVFAPVSASQVQSAATSQSQVALVVPSPTAISTVVSGHSTADPFGIHLVGGSEPGIDDATTKWDDFPVLMPDSLLGDAATGVAVLPFTAADEAGVSMTVVMDAIFQQLPLWTRAESALVGAVEQSAVPLADFSVEGNRAAPPHLKSEASRWPSLAAGVLLTTGMTAAAADVHRRRSRLPYSTMTE